MRHVVVVMPSDNAPQFLAVHKPFFEGRADNQLTSVASGVTLSSRSEGSNTAASSSEYRRSPSVVQAAHSRPVGLKRTQLDLTSSRVCLEPSAPRPAPFVVNVVDNAGGEGTKILGAVGGGVKGRGSEEIMTLGGLMA